MNTKNILLAGVMGAAAVAPVIAKDKRPNIIYIFTDQQNAMAMSCSGNKDIHTPNMDRLAKEGIRFTNAYCAAPLSTPNRAAMMTGVTPSVVGMMKNGSPFNPPYSTNSLGILMKNAGYDCGYGGKWHLPESDIIDNKYGFKKIHDHDDYGLAEACGEFIKANREEPFFLVASFDNPHNICEYARHQNIFFAELEEPHIADCPNLPANFAINPFDADVIRDEQAAKFKTYPVRNYTIEDWRRYRNAYYRLTEAVDAEIGKILKVLDEKKLWDNTIVIFTSDHGDGNGAHQWSQKSALYEETTNIPFIVRMPEQKKRGIVKEQLVNNGMDLLPTICNIAGAKVPDHCLGSNLQPLFEGSDKEINNHIVIETLFDEGITKGWCVRTKDYKYVAYDKGRYREQLYDMNLDRGEMINLAVEAKYKDILDAHRKLLAEWHKKHRVAIDKRATPIFK
ncbi:MAG: sulfatase family protein [Bacteroidales bacterium]